jgi:hypothetical protein
MSWFRRFVDGRRGRADEVARLRREVAEAINPDEERSMVVEDGRAMVIPGQILENLFHRMERLDLDPDTSWAPNELMSEPEMAVMFTQFRQGRMVITETAWYARKILARWPLQFVEHPIADEARLEAFLYDVQIDDHLDDAARRVFNRALASPEHVDIHPELDDLNSEDLMGVWLALTFWFGIKSNLLNKRA